VATLQSRLSTQPHLLGWQGRGVRYGSSSKGSGFVDLRLRLRNKNSWHEPGWMRIKICVGQGVKNALAPLPIVSGGSRSTAENR